MYRERQVVDMKKGNVIGDNSIDTIYITAEKTPDSPFWVNIMIVVQDGRTNQYTQIPLKQNQGYNPTLFLGDFTGDRVEDIMVVMDTGGSGGMLHAYVFAYRGSQFRPLFDSDVFNDLFKYRVFYLDYYKAQVNSYTTNQKFIIDLTTRGRQYLSEIYYPNGKLKKPSKDLFPDFQVFTRSTLTAMAPANYWLTRTSPASITPTGSVMCRPQ